MLPLSVVVITKNEAKQIEQLLLAVQVISNNIVIVDSGSTDGTLAICQKYNCEIILTDWQGFAINKNLGNAAAQYDWIWSLDADEIPNNELIATLKNIDLTDSKKVFQLPFTNYLGNVAIKHGSWANADTVCIFNRKQVKWSNDPVHEILVLPNNAQIVAIKKGMVHHYTASNIKELQAKNTVYARLGAQKYFSQQKKCSLLKNLLAPIINFLKGYVIKLGFLDGQLGFKIAMANAQYTYLKYKILRHLYKS
jgi:glycosyltransferase involved in cell wall biosynthesis